MTNNKFWLVYKDNISHNKHDKQEKAITEAKEAAISNTGSTYFVLEATHHFKADVSVVETSFEDSFNDADTDDFYKQCTPKNDFKVGDYVKFSRGKGAGYVLKIFNNLSFDNELFACIDCNYGFVGIVNIPLVSLTHA